MLYGEGNRAFLRLQEEIMRKSNDHSLLAWKKPEGVDVGVHGLLADSPEDFAKSSEYHPYLFAGEPLTMTGRGLSTTLGLHVIDSSKGLVTAKLSCPHSATGGGFLTISLLRMTTGVRDYGRIDCDGIGFTYDETFDPEHIFVPQEFPSKIGQDATILKYLLRISVVTKLMEGFRSRDDDGNYRIVHVWHAPFFNLDQKFFGAPKTFRGRYDVDIEIPTSNKGLLAIIVCEAVAVRERVAIFLDYQNGELGFDLMVPSSADNAASLVALFYRHALGRTVLTGRHSLKAQGWHQLLEGKMSYDLKLIFQETQAIRPQRIEESGSKPSWTRLLKRQ